MRILLVTPSPPVAAAPSAVPVVAWAQLQGLAGRHEITVVTIAGPDPRELDALERLRAAGFDVRAAERRDASAAGRAPRGVRQAEGGATQRRPL
jgi:hypothetical protein